MIGALKKISWYLLLPLAAMAVAMLLLAWWLVATPTGTQWSARQLLSSLPVDIQVGEMSGTYLEGLDMGDIVLTTEDLSVRIDTLSGRWDLLSVLGGQFHLKRLQADGVLVTLAGQDRHTPAEPTPWPSLAPAFPVTVDHLEVGNIRLKQGDAPATTLGTLVFRGVISPRQYHVHLLEASHPRGSASLAGTIAGRFPYRHSLTLTWTFAGEELALSGEGRLAGTLNDTRLHHRLLSPAAMVSEGTLGLRNSAAAMDFTPSLLLFDIQHQWRELALTLGDFPVVLAGGLQQSGTGDDFAIALDAELADSNHQQQAPLAQLLPGQQVAELAAPFFPATLTLEASGSARGLAIASARVAGGEGEAHLSGDLNWSDGLAWSDGLKWDMVVAARRLNLAPFLPAWPATLSGTVATSGHVNRQGYSAALHSDDLAGHVADTPFQARVAATLAPQQVRIDTLAFASAGNVVEAAGTVGAQSDITWDIDAPQLAALGVGLGGALTSSGRFSGTVARPLITVTLDADSLAFREWSAARARVRLTAGEQGHLAVDGRVSGFAGPGLARSDITLDGRGTLANHRLALAYTSAAIQAQLTATGAYRELAWQGTVADLSLSTPHTGPLGQLGDAALALAPDRMAATGLCLAQGDARLCGSATYGEGALSARGELAGLALAYLEPWLPRQSRLSGVLDGEFQYGGEGAARRGHVSLRARDARLSHAMEGEEPHSHPLALDLDGTLVGDQVRVNGRLAIAEATMSMAATAGLAEKRPLAGNLDLAVPDLAWLEAFAPPLAQPQGRLAGRLALAGTLDAPDVTGTLTLSDFAATLRATGTALTDGGASLDISDDGLWRLRGEVTAGEGVATISGEGRTAELVQGTVELTLRGDNLSVADLPDTRLRVSPDLRYQHQPGRGTLSGTLHIPSAAITLRELPEGAVSVSDDQVLLPPEDTATPGQFSARLDIRLGDQVRIQGYGLDTRLAGNLDLRLAPSGATTARGRIELRQGTFQAYGQDLKISQGHLIFQGDPENPGLNIVAVRETPSAEVGLRVTGVLKDFESEVFSSPPLPPTDALVLLVTGKPPTGINEAEANLVMNAATALGIAQSGWITSRLQSTLGLDTLTLEGGDTYEQSSLVVGKQLSPRLFLSYVQNLFSPASSVILQYQLSERLGLKAESGEFHSLDLMYRIEH